MPKDSLRLRYDNGCKDRDWKKIKQKIDRLMNSPERTHNSLLQDKIKNSNSFDRTRLVSLPFILLFAVPI